jgi:hypothetical protein
VSRASRLTQVLEIDPPFGDCHAADVRREAHRTTPGAGVLPRKTNCMVPAEASSPGPLHVVAERETESSGIFRMLLTIQYFPQNALHVFLFFLAGFSRI